MGAGGSGDKETNLDSERPESAAGRGKSGIDRLPSNATQVGGSPQPTQEPGNSAANAPKPSDRMPPAGPHADPDLVNPDSTPGTGALQPPGGHDDVDSTSG